MSGFNPTLDPKPVQVRRLEVLTGVGGRRRWSPDDKARIVKETLARGATVSDVARRHDIRPQQLFGWRRRMRIADPEPRMTFVPALVEAPAKAEHPRPKPARTGRGDIELGRGGGDQGAEGRAVIPAFTGTPGSVRVLVATRPVDFRKSMGGLAALVKDQLLKDPYSGVIYVFRAKRRPGEDDLVVWHGPVALGQDARTRRLHLAQTAGWGDAVDACAARGPAGGPGLAARAADSPDPSAGGDGVRLRRSESGCTRGRHKAARIWSDRAWPRRFPAMWRCCKPCS